MGKQKEWEDVLVVTTGEIAGKKIVKTLGTIQITWASSMKNHKKKMQKKAYEMGANAIIGYSIYGGTAVIAEDE